MYDSSYYLFIVLGYIFPGNNIYHSKVHQMNAALREAINAGLAITTCIAIAVVFYHWPAIYQAGKVGLRRLKAAIQKLLSKWLDDDYCEQCGGPCRRKGNVYEPDTEDPTEDIWGEGRPGNWRTKE